MISSVGDLSAAKTGQLQNAAVVGASQPMSFPRELNRAVPVPVVLVQAFLVRLVAGRFWVVQLVENCRFGLSLKVDRAAGIDRPWRY